MAKVAFLFAGQGAQFPGMGADIAQASKAAADVFAAADAVRPGTSSMCFEGSADDLKVTANTQPCVFATDLACARALAEAGVTPSCVAGFSLGEIAALTFAGALTDSEGMGLVCHRGELMDAASQANPGGMRAVVKLDANTVEQLAEQAKDCWPVNYNSAAQTVVAGLPDGLARLDDLVRSAGGRAMAVKVSGAFHSPLMASASEGLSQYLAQHPLETPQVDVFGNTDAAPYSGSAQQMADKLAAQASHPVRWQQTIEAMVEQGVDTFVEVGPGKTLTGLVRRITPDATALTCGTVEQLNTVIETLMPKEA